MHTNYNYYVMRKRILHTVLGIKKRHHHHNAWENSGKEERLIQITQRVKNKLILTTVVSYALIRTIWFFCITFS